MEIRQLDLYGNIKTIRQCAQKQKIKKLNTKNKILKCKIKSLYELYEELYYRLDVGLLEPRDYIIKENIRIYPEDKQAEPIDLIELTIEDIDERINKMKVFMEKYDKIRVGT